VTTGIKIIIVSGQEFSVPADTDVEAVRETLKPNFPDVANATPQKGKRMVDGLEVETIEFVKRAGTKGSRLLAELLARIPPRPISGESDEQLPHQLLGEQLTFDEALDGRLARALTTLANATHPGDDLCKALDSVPAAVSATPCGW